jgi:hypothetical protein
VDWQQAIENWRRLPQDEKDRIRWQRIPLNVAQSMEFAGEPVSLEMLEAEHAKRPMPVAGRSSDSPTSFEKPGPSAPEAFQKTDSPSSNENSSMRPGDPAHVQQHDEVPSSRT